MAAQQTDPQYKVRMPEELHARLKAAAESNKRSMNAEIVARLEESFDGYFVGDPNAAKLMKELLEGLYQSLRTRKETSVTIGLIPPSDLGERVD